MKFTPLRFFVGGAGSIASLLMVSCEPAPQVSTQPVEESARAILDTAEPLKRSADFAALLLRADPADLPEIRSAVEDSSIYSGDPEVALLAMWWARFDPEAAREWTATDWRAAYGSVIAAVFRSWGHSDPEAAFAGIASITAPVQRELATNAVVLGWDESGRPGLLDFLKTLPEGIQQQRPTEVLARRRVIELGAEEAIAWVDSLPDDAFKFVLRNRVASATAESDPAIAAKWAEPYILAAERPTGLPRRIGTRWARLDGRSAMQWLSTLPAGNDRNDGVTETFRDWMKYKPQDAIGWAIEMKGKEPLDAWREPALAVHSRLMLHDDPEGALELTRRFSDEELRNMTTTVLARTWLETDKDPADAWLQAADIPYDVRRRAYMINSNIRRQYRDEGSPLRLPDPPIRKEDRAMSPKKAADSGPAKP